MQKIIKKGKNIGDISFYKKKNKKKKRKSALIDYSCSRNGIKITSKTGVDLFVLDDPMKFRKGLKKAIDKLESS